MKNLHKKIGAMVLAGMVVLGGVAAGGVNSFAASKEVVSKNVKQNSSQQKVEFFVKKYGEIIQVNKDEKEIKKVIRKKYKKAYNMGRSVKIKNASQISVKLYEAKCYKQEVISINYEDMNYLIKVK